ncbi:SDR family NAD(P)-dependent oxidoreductase [Burkholderia ubonensis]|uniref:SDR family NAD(P)-dependent oxidoreductase n=1 Tax=Burkholderia ubonensis TaxID=101571 RepID=UPI000BA770A3|nr:glucose 1-dehydrogenase [Burkholderia ubonensis]PAJ85324.1 short-chain dehydrogenase [Burkholderia ubonensis]PAJ92270.1 short-chain dehydrogenase [Burkholderia ubonensis]PAK05626.1 short-chain dehydrogenase [Burkholderia ubonensis]PAK14456.1 short-chain dehydrogenase [Burkholderia ubonensis]RQP67693.1 SDR family oxidoreductase [Burkholderia ubonensis]
MSRLNGKVAIVTGASKGIGAAIAIRLAKDGAAVAVNYSRSSVDADRVVDAIRKAGGTAIAIQADVAKESEVKRLFADAKTTLGAIDILVNNAGVYEPSPLAEVTEQQFHWHFNLNVLGVILASKEAAAYFGLSGGNIINISSSVTGFTPANSTVYTASKAAVDAITKTLAIELGPRKIRVNAINPGMVLTEGFYDSGFSDEGFREHIESITPLGRVGKPDDIAPAVAFLASEEASWISGETLVIGGGLH